MSRHSKKFGEYTVIGGNAHQLGKFLQVTKDGFSDDPSGEGYILEADEKFGITANLTGIEPNKGSFEQALKIAETLLKNF